MGHLGPLSLTHSGALGYSAASRATSSAAVLATFSGRSLPIP